MVPRQSLEERAAELKILQIIQQRAPVSFVTIKLGLVRKGSLVATKDMMATIYAGVTQPGDTIIVATNDSNATGTKRGFESSVSDVANDGKPDSCLSSSSEVEAQGKSKKRINHDADTMPCPVEGGLAFLVQACEQAIRHG